MNTKMDFVFNQSETIIRQEVKLKLEWKTLLGGKFSPEYSLY